MTSMFVSRGARRAVSSLLCTLCTATLPLIGCSQSDSDSSETEPATAGSGGSTAAEGGSRAGSGGAASSSVSSSTTSSDPVVSALDAWKLDVSSEDMGSWASDCEQFYSFRAHGKTEVNDSSKYMMPTGSEYYESFFFTAPWGEQDVQALEFRPVIDNPKIVHHWILYGVPSANQANGSMQGGPSQFLPVTIPGEAFINGWAPGGVNTVMPEQVGLYVPHGAKATYRLEVHYNNLAGTGAELDGSGVDFCVSTKKREQEAGTHFLGTASISIPAKSKRDVVSTCAPNVTAGPVHVMSISPHMHQTGVHAKATLQRADGKVETIIDGPFAFSDQKNIWLPTDKSSEDLLINPGDKITTTCTFDNQTDRGIAFGENTNDEMCFFFTTAWPRGQLANGLFTLIPGADRMSSCLQ